MTSQSDAVRAMQGLMKQKQEILESWPAYTGNEDGTVQGSKPNFIYVRYPTSDSPAVEVYNGTSGVGWIAGLKIRVGYRSERPDLLQVLGEADQRIEVDSTQTIIYTPLKPHAPQHMWGYSDPVFLRFRQITDLAIYISTGLTIQISAGVIKVDSGYVKIASQTLDLTSYVPVSGEKYILLSIDGVGAIIVTSAVSMPCGQKTEQRRHSVHW